MQRWGRQKSGSKRWRCPNCGKNTVWKRKDNRTRSRLFLFVKWLTAKHTLAETAGASKVSVKTLERRFVDLWRELPKPKPSFGARVLVVDGTSVVRSRCMLLIAGDGDKKQPVSWLPVMRECYAAWQTFLAKLAWEGVEPSTVVCDGQRGLLKAIHEVWPKAQIQRCLVHIIRQSMQWLTRRPKTRAGCELRVLVLQLSGVRTRRQKRRWIRAFRYWCRRHNRFLKERTQGPNGRWWYTHRKLRGTRSLLRNAIPDLFRFVTDPTLPRTSNHVEGGCNSRLKELFRSHRGLSLTKKLALASWYLALRQGQKPTRNVY